MKRLKITAVLCLALSSAAIADERAAKQAANNLAHEHLICAAYTTIVSACLIQKNPNDPDMPRYKQFTDTLLERGLRIGEAANVSLKASEARFKMANKLMMTEIENNCSNISILMEQHLETCLALHNEGPDRVKAIAEALAR